MTSTQNSVKHNNRGNVSCMKFTRIDGTIFWNIAIQSAVLHSICSHCPPLCG